MGSEDLRVGKSKEEFWCRFSVNLMEICEEERNVGYRVVLMSMGYITTKIPKLQYRYTSSNTGLMKGIEYDII